MNLSDLYQSMFEAKQIGDHKSAEALMLAIESLRNQNRAHPDPLLVENEIPKLPDFAQSVLDKSQLELGRSERSNCINAAFNYHDSKPNWDSYSTMDFLNRIKSDFVQLDQGTKAQRGDLVVLWSRIGGSWDNRLIDVHQIDPSSSDFPYGLVFDHVAVRLTEELVFHKPDPTPSSRYQIEALESIMSVTLNQKGFEMTFHRKKA